MRIVLTHKYVCIRCVSCDLRLYLSFCFAQTFLAFTLCKACADEFLRHTRVKSPCGNLLKTWCYKIFFYFTCLILMWHLRQLCKSVLMFVLLSGRSLHQISHWLPVALSKLNLHYSRNQVNNMTVDICHLTRDGYHNSALLRERWFIGYSMKSRVTATDSRGWE